MANISDAPRVFISYSWSSTTHENWVLMLAERIMSDGVEVILDKWDLKEGQDKYAFIERMVTDLHVKKVLVICDSEYATKADNRSGGVGTESQIISDEVYRKVDQTKFIPVIREFNSEGQPCVPVYLKGRIYIDLSTDERFADEYEKLLRSIFDRPSHRKPPLGTPPARLFEDAPRGIQASHKLATFKDSVLKDRPYSSAALADYLNALLSAFQDFRLDSGDDQDKPLDQQVVDSIDRFLPYRDEFAELVAFLSAYSPRADLSDKLFDFFESAASFMFPPSGANSYDTAAYDNFRFILYELFLHLIATLVNHDRFELAASFLQRDYYYSDGQTIVYSSFPLFNPAIRSLEETRNRRLQLRNISLTADLIKARSTLPRLDFTTLMQSDLSLCLRSVLSPTERPRRWWPRTLVYAQHSFHGGMPLYARARSSPTFDRLKILLGVESRDDLLKRYVEARDRFKMDQWSFDGWPIEFAELANLANLGTA